MLFRYNKTDCNDGNDGNDGTAVKEQPPHSNSATFSNSNVVVLLNNV